MTKTTDTRQLRLLIEGTIQAYGIDNLQLEIDLFSGIKRLLESDTPVRTRETVLASLRKTLELGALRENLVINMEARVKACMGIDVSGRERYRPMIDYLIKKDTEGQTVEAFAKWCQEHPFNAPKAFKIAENPDLLMINWPAAFTEAITVHEYVTL